MCMRSAYLVYRPLVFIILGLIERYAMRKVQKGGIVRLWALKSQSY